MTQASAYIHEQEAELEDGGQDAQQSTSTSSRPEDLAPPPPEPPETDSGGGGEDSHLLSGLRDGAWLDVQDFPPLAYAVDGIIPEGMSVIAGAPKVGKSALVLDIALAVAAGGCAFGHLPVEKRPVLYLALEDGHRRMQDRCRTLLGGEPIPPAFEYLTAIQPGTVQSTIEAWLARHPAEAPLVIVDTLAKVKPPAQYGESAYQHDYRVASMLKRLVDDRPGSSLVINHHDRKAGADDYIDRVSGTHGVAGAADTIIIVSRPRGEQEATLQVAGRDVPEGEYAARYNLQRWALAGDDLAAAARAAEQQRSSEGLGDRSAEVVAYVGEHPDGVRAGDVAADLDIDEKTASTYLIRAYKAERIAKPQRGLYTPVGSVGSVGSPDGEPNTSNSQEGCVSCGRPATARHDLGYPLHSTCPDPHDGEEPL